MPTRIDWLDDPNAPDINRIVPAASVVVTDVEGRLLLIRRSDNGNWSLPGGAMEYGESIAQTAVRETREETGLDIEVTELLGIFSNPNHRVEYTSNGEVRQEFSVLFTGRVIGGRETTNSEATAVAWFDSDELGDLQIHDAMRNRIDHYLKGEGIHYS